MLTLTLLVALVLGPDLPTPPPARIVPADEVVWVASPKIPGLETAVVDGDPATGPHTVLLRVRAGTTLPPHWHDSVEITTVVSGTLLLGEGDTMDDAHARRLGPGSYFVIPRRAPHWGRAITDAILSRQGTGRADFHPADRRRPR